MLSGGLGNQIASLLSQEDAGVKTRCLGIHDEFVEQGSQEELRAMYHLDATGIIDQVIRLFPELLSSSAYSLLSSDRGE